MTVLIGEQMSCLNAFVSESFTLVWVPSDACRIAGIAKKVVWDQPHSVPFCKSFWAWPRAEYKRQMWLWHKSAPNKDKVWKEERPLQEWKCKNCSEVGTELSGSWKELSHRNKKKYHFSVSIPLLSCLLFIKRIFVELLCPMRNAGNSERTKVYTPLWHFP